MTFVSAVIAMMAVISVLIILIMFFTNSYTTAFLVGTYSGTIMAVFYAIYSVPAPLPPPFMFLFELWAITTVMYIIFIAVLRKLVLYTYKNEDKNIDKGER